MKSIRYILLTFSCFLILGSMNIFCGKKESTELPNLIPREVIFGNPLKLEPKLSPDGKMISYLAPVQNALNIWVGTIGRDDMHPVTRDTLRGIRSYYWTFDSQHILYLKDYLGNEAFHLFVVDLESGQTRDLTPFEGVTTGIIKQDFNYTDEILITLNKDDPRLRDAYRLNFVTGGMKRVTKDPGGVLSWLADRQMKVRAAHFVRPDGGYSLKVRHDESSEWKSLVEWGPDDAMSSAGLGFTQDGRSMYLIDSRGVNAGRLVKMDIYSGKMDVLAENPQYDISGVMADPATFEVQAVLFEKDRQEIVILDDSIRDDIEILESLHPGDLIIADRDNADNIWLIAYTSDQMPLTYYAFDRRTNDATLLFHHRPGLNDYRLAEMEAISFKARDGLLIHGYITYPPGRSRKNLPTVLLVHGGPWIRDTWGFDEQAQWLSNRGYACIQVNYRGSAGYGKKFLNAGNKQWGRGMQDDLIDAVNWAVENGIADPKRIAIYGQSFGGYAALAGATFTPDVFCCAVAASGPSNLLSYIQSIPPQYSSILSVLFRRVGNPATEEDLLKSQSPFFKVNQIKIPVLIAHGAQDPRVKEEEARQIVAELVKNNIDHEFLLFEDEGHWILRPENQFKFYAAVEEFLARHLGGRSEPPSADDKI